MAKLTTALAKIDLALGDAAIYTREPARAAELNKQRSDAASALTGAEEKWLALSSEYESAMKETA